MAGANTGDFAARYLHLGHTGGLLPLALVFLLIAWAETQSRRAIEAYYWLAIIVLRTAATNIADLMTRSSRRAPQARRWAISCPTGAASISACR